MTSPGDERAADGRPDPAVPPPPARSPYPPQYGQQQYGQPPYAGNTPAEPPYVYNPYGNFPYPASYPSTAGPGPEPAPPPKRPGSMHLALVLVVVAALPYLFAGLVAVGGAGQAATALPPDSVTQLEQLGVTVDQFAQVVRTTGILILVVALAYVLLAVLAWTGRRWARGLLAALTVGFVLMAAVFVLAVGAQAPAVGGGGALVLAVPLVLAIAAVGLMFGGAARDWFTRR